MNKQCFVFSAFIVMSLFFISSARSTLRFYADGTVYSILPAGDTTYFGGDFRNVGLYSGRGIPVDYTTGRPFREFEKIADEVTDEVTAVGSDGKGGWYVGVSKCDNWYSGACLTEVSNLSSRVVHILADGSPDPSFQFYFHGVITTFALDGTILYVGGISGIIAIDLTTNTVKKWAPRVYNMVHSIVSCGRIVYVGGFCHGITPDYQPRVHLIAIDSVTAEVTEWKFQTDSMVQTLLLHSNVLYIGGNFIAIDGEYVNKDGMGTLINGKQRSRLAAYDLETGKLTSWNPGANGPVVEMAAMGNTIYIGGDFDSVGGQRRCHIAAVNVLDGKVTDWNPNANGQVKTISVLDNRIMVQRNENSLPEVENTVYIGGRFSEAGGRQRAGVAAIDPVTGEAREWNLNVNGAVNTVCAGLNAVYIGGNFDRVDLCTRAGIASVNTVTGRITDFNPGVGGTVNALARNGSTLYIGGTFESIQDEKRRNIGAVDVVTGLVTAWNPGMTASGVRITTNYVIGGGGLFITDEYPNTGFVSSLIVGDSLLYVCGSFDTIGGALRRNIAALDLASGNASEWNPDIHGTNPYNAAKTYPEVLAMDVKGNTVYAAGDFDSVGSEARGSPVAIDARTGEAAAWNPAPDDRVLAIAADGPTVYVGGWFHDIGGEAREFCAALDSATGSATAWNAHSDNIVNTLCADKSAIYIGGSFSNIGGKARTSVAVLDKETGLATDWNRYSSIGPAPTALAFAGARMYTGCYGENPVPTEMLGWNPSSLNYSQFCVLDTAPEPVIAVRMPQRKNVPMSPVSFRLGMNGDGPVCSYTLGATAPVTITMLNLQGRVLASIVKGTQSPGSYRIPLPTRLFSKGLILVKFRAGRWSTVRRLVWR